ncbi:MAG: TPM domain-containing protein, partial [Ginsengibacter sp.]
SEEDSLESLLQHFEKETTVEISIVTVDSNMVHKDSFNDFSDHILKIWGIGKLIKENGIVICISKDYKKLFISTGAGISKYISDPDKNRIIEQYFIPQYNEHNYFAGTLNGVNEIMNRISSKINSFQR